MVEELLRSKFLGALVGTGVGDSLGAGFEGWGRVALKEVEQAAEIRKTLTYTDDTHMMIGIAESLIKSKGFNAEDMAYTFASNYELEPWRGYGPAPPYIFRLIRDGLDWGQAAKRFYDGGSYGNGSAMRIAPIGVFYHDNLTLLRDVACESSRITHAHTLGKEGAALQACAIALATNLVSPKRFWKVRMNPGSSSSWDMALKRSIQCPQLYTAFYLSLILSPALSFLL